MTSGPTRREVIGTLGAGSLVLAGTPAAFRHAAARVLAQDAGTLIRGGRVVNADGTTEEQAMAVGMWAMEGLGLEPEIVYPGGV